MKTAELDVAKWTARDEAKKWSAGKTPQDKMIAKAFRAISRGQKVIDLYESMRLAGCDSVGRPLLAIGRADATFVTSSVHGGSDDVYFRWDTGRYSTTRIPIGYFPALKQYREVRARVPTVPPLLRQANLARLCILFEAAWEQVTKDPLLLEPLGGALYRVVGQWDLTPIEQAVLRGRR